MSPTATLAKMDELGAHYDREVLEWRDLIIKKMKSSGKYKFMDFIIQSYIHVNALITQL